MVKVFKEELKSLIDIREEFLKSKIILREKYEKDLEELNDNKEKKLLLKIKELKIKEKIFEVIKNLNNNTELENSYLYVWGFKDDGANVDIYINKELNQVRYLSRVYNTGVYSLEFEQGYQIQYENEKIIFNKYSGYRKENEITHYVNKAKISQKSIPSVVWINLYYLLCLQE